MPPFITVLEVMQVSEFIVKFMERLGVRQIFGIPGAHILPVYDSLYDSSIRSILVKHEQAAAFMAGGVARTTGQISACITTAGPGATNLVTGIANAYADKLPILVITGETPTHIFGKGGLQESSGEGGTVDQNQLFSGITRYHRIIERTDYLTNVLTQAAQILLSSDSGPVVISLPYNIQQEEIDPAQLDTLPIASSHYGAAASGHTIREICNLLTAAKRPIAVAGYGCIQSGAMSQLSQLSERFGIEVSSTLKGKGAIDERTARALGTLGVTSDGRALHAITQEADLLLVLGASFNERTSYLWNSELFNHKTIIQVDRERSQLEKVFRADIAVESDISELLDALLNHLDQNEASPPIPAPPGALPEEESPILLSTPVLIRHFFEQLEQQLEGEISLFDDNIIYGQNLFKASSIRHYYPNTGFSSLGHALPAALGASINHHHPTFALLGDGGFQMCGMELMTAVNYSIPVNTVVLNNGSMGLIRKNQFQQYRGRYIDCDFSNPDFSLLAKSFGVDYIRINQPSDLDTLFNEMDLHKGINLIEIPIDKNAFPDYRSGR